MVAETQTESPWYLLQQAVQDTIAGKVDNQVLSSVLEATAQGIDAMASDFTAAADELEPQTRKKVQPMVEAARRIFEQVEGAQLSVQDYLEQGDRELLLQAADTLGRSRFQLDSLFRDLQNAVRALRGPTEIANLNAMLWAYEFYRQDPRKDRALRELAEAERKAMEVALHEIGQGTQTPAIAELRRALEAHNVCAGRLNAAMDSLRGAEVGRAMEAIRDSFFKLKELIPAASLSQRSSGATAAPHVDLVLALTDELAGGKIQDAPLQRALSTVTASIQKSKAYFSQLSSDASASKALNEEIGKAKRALDLQEEATREYSTYFAGRDLSVLARAKEKLTRSARSLWEAYQAITVLADREGKIACVGCGAYNPEQRNRCEKCGMVLTRAMSQKTAADTSTFQLVDGQAEGISLEPAAPEGPILTENLVRLYAAVEAIAADEISDEEYLGEVGWFEDVLLKNVEYEDQSVELEALTGAEREAAERKLKRKEKIDVLFKEGFEDLIEGLAQLQQFTESRSRSDLENGVRRCNSGAKKMLQVQDTDVLPSPPAQEKDAD